MINNVTIRPYHPGDISDVMEAWKQANALAHPFLSEEYTAQVEREVRELYIPKAETYVLQEGSRVVGFVALLGNDIGGLFVEPAKHGKGYGRALVDHAVAIKGPLKVEVFRDNDIGRAFYERYGFLLVAAALHEPSGQIVHAMAMPDR